ncbi:MAG: hypothetical protein LBJ59_08740 [Zoogloeaceae bacterium]|nr:hypothetical protein [Zoogloeaceae bacterium]
MNELSTVGKRLRSERIRLGYNTRDFAKAGGIGKGSQSRYENDETRPDSEYLNRISALGAEIFWIMRGSEEDDEARDKRAALYPPEIRKFIEDYLRCPDAIQVSLRAIAAEAAEKTQSPAEPRQTKIGMAGCISISLVAHLALSGLLVLLGVICILGIGAGFVWQAVFERITGQEYLAWAIAIMMATVGLRVFKEEARQPWRTLWWLYKIFRHPA